MGVIVSGGAIIPYASGAPVALTTFIPDAVGAIALIGFGSSAQIITPLGAPIELTGGPATVLNMAFSMPRDGELTSIGAFFSTTAEVNLPGVTVTISAQLFSSPTPDNIFTPIAGTEVILAPALTGVLPPDTTSNGLLDGLAIPVTAETRLLMVFFARVQAQALFPAVMGYASAGVNIV